MKNKKILFPILLIIIGAVTILMFYLSYNYDNKYALTPPPTSHGVVDIREYNDDIFFLTSGWGVYEQKLLTPNAIVNKPIPDRYIDLGQYSGFEFDDPDASPFGCATYILKILLPPERKEYMLELPEIYSAYKLYINGELLHSAGNIDEANYEDELQNTSVVFNAKGEVTILLAVSNYTSLASGLIYPPAFGDPTQITYLLNSRLIFRAMLLFITCTIGVFYCIIGIKVNNKNNSLLFGILCLFYIGYISYPLIRTFFHIPVQPLQMIEQICYYAFLLCIILLQCKIIKIKNKTSLFMTVFGCAVIVITALLPLIFNLLGARILYAYLTLVFVYKASIFLFSFICVIYTLKHNTSTSKISLTAFVIFPYSLLFDRLYPMFEPIKFGWFIEIAGFLFICMVAGIVGYYTVRVFTQNTLLQSDVKNISFQLELQKERYSHLIENIEETKKARHDLRHHLTLIQSYIAKNDNENLKSYIDEYSQSLPSEIDLKLCNNSAIDAIAKHYVTLASQNNITINVDLELPEEVTIADSDLCVVFGNLLENAIEACVLAGHDNSFISIHAKTVGIMFCVIVDNNFDGQLSKENNLFLSKKRTVGHGIGLKSICAIAEKYDGEARFEPDFDKKIFTSTVLMKIK